MSKLYRPAVGRPGSTAPAQRLIHNRHGEVNDHCATLAPSVVDAFPVAPLRTVPWTTTQSLRSAAPPLGVPPCSTGRTSLLRGGLLHHPLFRLVVGPAVQDHRAGLDRPGRPVLLPRRAEQDEPGLAAVDVHGDGTAPRRADDHLRLVLVELGLGDPDGLVEVLVGQLRVDDLVAVLARKVGLTPPGTDCQPWRKRTFIAGAGPPSPESPSACRVESSALLLSSAKQRSFYRLACCRPRPAADGRAGQEHGP